MTFARCFVVLLAVVESAGLALPAQAADGLITLPSNHPVDATIEKFQAEVENRGFMVFALLDHSAAAETADLKMPRATVIVFGNPRLGTPMFIKYPTLAIDLPLKALVWENADGEVFLSYNSAEYVYGTIFARHGAPSAQEAVQKLEAVLSTMAKEAVE